jgi:hypothetical protein
MLSIVYINVDAFDHAIVDATIIILNMRLLPNVVIRNNMRDIAILDVGFV